MYILADIPTRGASESTYHTVHLVFLISPQITGYRRFLPQFHCGSDRGRRCLLVCTDGYQETWQSTGERIEYNMTLKHDPQQNFSSDLL